jgi:hypothetical protein
LSAGARLPIEFKHEDAYRQPVPVSLVIFLRSDIFYRLTAAAREPDKIIASKVDWQDRELLLRVIDERFASSHEGNVQPAELWTKYFCASVKGKPTRNYISSRILPRPRDLVFFVKAAVSTAVNRGHPMVRESDILDAERQYSQYALESILVENGVSVTTLEAILYEFAGCESHLSEDEVKAHLSKAGVSAGEQRQIIDHLCSLAFLGLQVRPGDYRFAEDPAEQKRNLVLAKQSLRPGEQLMFAVHAAFWAFLEVAAA